MITKLTPEAIEANIADYFQKANAGVIDYKGEPTKRGVPARTHEQMLDRANYSCFTCGSDEQLEVDHSRALMNGGSNDRDNLETLCRDCHSIKTGMDRSLRRARE